ncbi:hypothetical protein DM02DRAFT_609878 [Periconia macrospinosa]|uniref:Uncharacterized protein n=1 Tax=Periconia macrospinosa TaxID=97972 RepID=A0A2V1E725_9PLEO|nr:hypothetical protein DM02DRAFT_609878 [Periconia macrospinosa]
MESAHLTKAHEHARNAATATYGNSIATAGHEHDSAASAFHQATHDTANSEALRILNLLEHHHQKLAGLIKEPPRRKETSKPSNQNSDASTATVTAKPTPTRSSSPPATSASPSTRTPSRRRLPQSSIATNLAEKRGIPRRGTPSAAPVSVANALASRNEHASTPVRDMLERQSRKAEAEKRTSADSGSSDIKQKQSDPSSVAHTPTEDNFRRFYSAFGGVISAISAPLAFTSLPLSPTPPTPALEPPPKKQTKASSKPPSRTQSPEASRTVKSSEPDLAALISKPALRALQEANTPHFANNESFYLVPTSGGTVSYANILQNPNAPLHHHHPLHAAQNPLLDPISEGDNEPGSGLKGSSHEEFVDARETVGPPSPTASRRPRSRGKTANNVAMARTLAAGRGAGQKTVEEYELQIETLLQTVDKQAKRIAMWETTSQSSHIALAQSFRARTHLPSASSDPSALAQALAMGSNNHPALPSPPIASNIPPLVSQTATSSSSPTTLHHGQQQLLQYDPDPAIMKRIAELESRITSQTAQITELTADKEQLTRQNEKNALVLARYREQWEKLKAGARKKQMERTEKKVAEMKESGAATVGGLKDEDGSIMVKAKDVEDVDHEDAGDVVGDQITPSRKVPWV